ncbi:MAG: DNA polymerase III subunit gamma/tau, partial [Bacteroidota bacterium]
HLAHAFLFCGPRGVGKTTCARILAKVINCQNLGDDFEACNECSSCKAFNENASFNITELDAASNNSVEHIRALIEQVRFQPQQGKFKVFIIDEVHMLSQQAFNAFLKTLEEPPPYAIFILATTEKHKIIPTILSRCQIFDFRRIQVSNMVEHLQDICQKEGIEADRDALHIIAQKADGALRDALSIFDRIVSFSGNRIVYQDVIENLNVLDYDYFFKIVDAMLTEDLASILLTFEDIQRKGFEADIFINGLAEHLRNLLVCKDEQTLPLLQVSDGLRQRYQQQAKVASASFLITLLNMANDCDVNYKMARNKRLHVEMALVKMVYINRAVQIGPANIAPPNIEKKTPEPRTAPINAPAPPAAPPTPASTTPPPPPVTPAAKETSPPPPAEATPPPPAEPVTTPSPAPLNSPPPPSTHQEVPPPPSTLPAMENGTSTPQASKPETNGQLSISSKHNVPGVNLDDLFSQAKQEEEAAKNETSEALDLTVVEGIWKEYAESIPSHSVRNTLRSTQLSVDQQTILATVGSAMSKEMIQQEKGLMDFLRQKLRARQLFLDIQIDSSKQPDAPKKPTILTTKEKYLLMKEKNPQVELLRQRFDLKPDND